MNTIDRRTLLKGFGAALALPYLEAMLPASAAAAQAARPVRMAFLFVPNGINMEHWTPAEQGAGFGLKSIMEPLSDLKGDFNVLTGLAQHNANALGDGPGDHARSAAAWLTGVHPRKTAGSDIKGGISVDQLAAMSGVGKAAKFPSLEIGCERGALAGDCDSGYSCAYSSSISWRGEATPNSKVVSPRALFEQLFGSGDAAEDAANRAKREKSRLSILDFVLEEADALRGKVGARDQQKLDEYLTSVREIESRLQASEAANSQAVLAGAQIPAPGMPADRGEHIRLMGDMMILAFQADLTRVATFMFANEGSNRPYREIQVADGHHDVSHHGRSAQKLEDKKKIDRYHAEQLAYILRKMKSIQEPGGGNLLDNSMVMYGGGISDGDRHNHDDLPILLAGKAGGKLKAGRHMVFQPNTPLTNLFLSMLDFQGAKVEKLGDSTGKLQGVF